MKSKIDTNERVKNYDRRFGSDLFYFPCMIDMVPALFTKNQLEEALKRAKRNSEDIPKRSFWRFLGL